MCRSSTDSGANDPPGEPAWPRWTEKEENELLCAGWGAAEQCEDSSLREPASFHHWCLELFGHTTVVQMELGPKRDGGLCIMQRNWKQIKDNKF